MKNIGNSISRRDIERALDGIKAEDIQRSQEILQSVFNSGKIYGNTGSLIPLLKNPTASIALKSIGLFIYRLWRVWSGASLIESARALKDLAWLQARLKAKYLKIVLPDKLTDNTDLPSTENISITGHNVLQEGIVHVYQLCVNRSPVQEEIDIWEQNFNNGLEFAEFFKSMYLSQEAEQHRKSSLAMVADFASRINIDIVDIGVIGGYQLCLGRTPQQVEINKWKENFSHGHSFAEFLCSIYNSQEAKDFRKTDLTLLSNGQFIQLVYEAILGRGCQAREIANWEGALSSGVVDRNAVLTSMFGEYAKVFALELESNSRPIHDGLSCHVMGSNQFISIDDWRARSQELVSGSQAASKESIFHSRFHIQRQPLPLVTAIASLFKGGKYIEQFMDNIVSQTCFDDYCELVIIDADSPENESKVIERYCNQHKNIVYRRMNHTIGIYDAWNVGAKLARGEYLTNTNLDDLRRHDSLELQAGVLDSLPFVDVVYQDFYYTFDSKLSVEEIARFGYRSTLPVITAHNMMDFNSPHNAPMWRKKLHDELGYFDVFYKSAGDYEFWMRCLAAKKVFYKINDPHVVYYQNPEGLSTRPDTRGVEEAQRILKTYGRRLVSENVVIPINQFIHKLSQKSGAPVQAANSRYTSAQNALRDVAIKKKYMHNTGAM